jgi:hypothetical protein
LMDVDFSSKNVGEKKIRKKNSGCFSLHSWDDDNDDVSK